MERTLAMNRRKQIPKGRINYSPREKRERE
jgi:hypothetical protein